MQKLYSKIERVFNSYDHRCTATLFTYSSVEHHMGHCSSSNSITMCYQPVTNECCTLILMVII